MKEKISLISIIILSIFLLASLYYGFFIKPKEITYTSYIPTTYKETKTSYITETLTKTETSSTTLIKTTTKIETSTSITTYRIIEDDGILKKIIIKGKVSEDTLKNIFGKIAWSFEKAIEEPMREEKKVRNNGGKNR